MNSTENSYQNEKKDIDALTSDFADIRKQIQELQRQLQNKKGNVAVPVQKTMVVEKTTTIPSTPQKEPVIVPPLNLKQVNPGNKNTLANNKILLNSASDKFKPERDSFDKNDLHLLANIVANRHDEVQNYLTPKQKDKIIGFANARLNFLKNNQTQENQSEILFLEDAIRGKYQEYKHRDDVTTFSPVSTDRSISVSPLVTPRSSSRSNSPVSTGRSTSSSPSSTHRRQVRHAWKGGKKTRKRKQRMTKRRRTNKKSHSHSHKKRHKKPGSSQE